MTITEIRDELTRLIDAGHGKEKLWDDDNPSFAITGILHKEIIDNNGEPGKMFFFDCDEV